MARIRTIKPEFWADEKLSPLDPVTRLVFLGLVCLADDAGRLLDNVRVLDAQMFPETEDSSREALANLSRIGRIRRGVTASGQRVIQVVNWERHQRVDHPNLQAALPEIIAPSADTGDGELFASVSRGPRETLATRPTTYDQRPTTKNGRSDLEGWEAEFLALWPSYPKRGNNPRHKALKAYLARRREGIAAEQLAAGVHAYARMIERERTEARFIMLAATFFGPDRRWEDDFGEVRREPEMVRMYTERGELHPDAARILGRRAA